MSEEQRHVDVTVNRKALFEAGMAFGVGAGIAAAFTLLIVSSIDKLLGILVNLFVNLAG